MRKYVIEAAGTVCPFCGGKPKKDMPVWAVSGPGYSGECCAFHLETLRQSQRADDAPDGNAEAA